MKTIKGKYTKLELFTEDVIEDIFKREAENRVEAVKHSVKKMKENVGNSGKSSPGSFPAKDTGILQKGIGYKKKARISRHLSIVGSKSPSSHLLEFGHGDGKIKNKRPFFKKTLIEENEKMKDIMSKKYW